MYTIGPDSAPSTKRHTLALYCLTLQCILHAFCFVTFFLNCIGLLTRKLYKPPGSSSQHNSIQHIQRSTHATTLGFGILSKASTLSEQLNFDMLDRSSKYLICVCVSFLGCVFLCVFLLNQCQHFQNLEG